ncbi:GNAT family N-acetyltransferase, partial [Priestia endophytica]|uniref:GNAT family N-acetyltransferase n=1 Tax=Priestia endophytica TaxID=135735 RepID=UPI003D28BF19
MNNITFRHATEQDLDTIVQMLADDILGSRRERYEKPLPISYIRAFQAIQLDPNNELIVACKDEKIVGVQQITFTPYFVRQGSWRATIEGVRIASSERNQGVGGRLIEWAIQRA